MRLDELKPGDVFVAPSDRDLAGARLRVEKIEEASNPEFVKLRVRTRNKNLKVYVGPRDEEV